MKKKEIQAKIAKKIRQIEKLEEKLKKVEVDFSILNDVDVFYVEYESGVRYLFEKDAFNGNNQINCFNINKSIIEYDLYDSSVKLIKNNIKTLRKATEEEIKLFNSKFAKYEVDGSITIEKYWIIRNDEIVANEIYDKQLAKDICEFLNKRL